MGIDKKSYNSTEFHDTAFHNNMENKEHDRKIDYKLSIFARYFILYSYVVAKSNTLTFAFDTITLVTIVTAALLNSFITHTFRF